MGCAIIFRAGVKLIFPPQLSTDREKMAIEVELPREIELRIRANKDLDSLVRRRLEHQIQKDIKNDLFLLMTFDDLLKNSVLTEKDIDDLDHRMKREMMEKLGWR
jgi:hypothetical protein